ncbi:MAG TPA: hypothetical protein VK714_04945 [Myxococcota bacterium]|nr:hypothetical protein [Myxococcota bacterium]
MPAGSITLVTGLALLFLVIDIVLVIFLPRSDSRWLAPPSSR